MLGEKDRNQTPDDRRPTSDGERQNLIASRASRHPTSILLFGIGFASLLPYLAALGLGDLRKYTIEFEIAFFTAFALYAAATVLALRPHTFSRLELVAAFALAATMGSILIFTRPTLSDDMYRYIWDGRVQAQGLSPYRYPPKADELKYLREPKIWKLINRKDAVTVYPPAAEMAYALLWRLRPDNVRWFQVSMLGGALLAGGVLVGLLKATGQSTARVIIYLWSPLLIFETAHSAHVDGLVLPLLVGAWWARVRERDRLVGVLLGLATATKLYPALLLPALWRPHHPKARWQMPLTFSLTLIACYLPYFVISGSRVLGYLPHYLTERFNLGLAGWLSPIFNRLGVDPNHGAIFLLLGALAVIALVCGLRPAPDGVAAVRRCVWLIGAFTLLTQNLFSWYLLWLLPLIALFLEPGKLLGLRLNAWSGWWWFCGLVALSYLFFIRWKPVPAALAAQFWPLYAFLLLDLVRRLLAHFRLATNASRTNLPEDNPRQAVL